jgi:hypothetical protein
LSEQNRNCSHFGWVLEFDLVATLFSASECSKELKVLSQSDNIVLWKVDNAEKNDGHSQSLGLWQSNQWKIPKSSRQAGFDAACLFEDHGKNPGCPGNLRCKARPSDGCVQRFGPKT